MASITEEQHTGGVMIWCRLRTASEAKISETALPLKGPGLAQWTKTASIPCVVVTVGAPFPNLMVAAPDALVPATISVTRPYRMTFFTFRTSASSSFPMRGRRSLVGRTAGSTCTTRFLATSSSRARSRSPSAARRAFVKCVHPSAFSRRSIHTSRGTIHVMSSGATRRFPRRYTTASHPVLPAPSTTKLVFSPTPEPATSSFGVTTVSPAATGNSSGHRLGTRHSPSTPLTSLEATRTAYPSLPSRFRKTCVFWSAT
mmetsp:Transcript_25279/g.50330  ORF Transcript_25279/g.50330 Transcript_25279/m.50330 type:complete len:258 (+) Transcript_25279:530-1303(+)